MWFIGTQHSVFHSFFHTPIYSPYKKNIHLKATHSVYKRRWFPVVQHLSCTHQCTFQSATKRELNQGLIQSLCTPTGAARPCRVRWGARCTRSARWTRTSRTSLTWSRGELHCAAFPWYAAEEMIEREKKSNTVSFNVSVFPLSTGHWIADGWSLRWQNGTSSHDKWHQGNTASGHLLSTISYFQKNQSNTVKLIFLEEGSQKHFAATAAPFWAWITRHTNISWECIWILNVDHLNHNNTPQENNWHIKLDIKDCKSKLLKNQILPSQLNLCESPLILVDCSASVENHSASCPEFQFCLNFNLLINF